jgi:hypothetical protein
MCQEMRYGEVQTLWLGGYCTLYYGFLNIH